MKRNIIKGILITLAAIFISIPCYVYADLAEIPDINTKSYGNIIYEDENGFVKIFAEDISFLKDEISSLPKDIFEPVFYSHNHDWKYVGVSEENHTRQCNICGTVITNVHRATDHKECSFVYNNKTYAGYDLICKCGYTWQEERGHNYKYTPLNAEKHIVSCVLNGTKYCGGMAEYEEEHILSKVPDTDDTHKVICSSCLYEKVESCIFTQYFHDELTGEDRLICECGNYIVIEGKTNPDQWDDDSISSNNPSLYN